VAPRDPEEPLEPRLAPVPPASVEVVIERNRSFLRLELTELWAYRELLYFLVWRDVKIRYKQTAIGAVWAILQPLLTMAIFSVVFTYVVRVPTDGVPYPLFVYAALLPWTYFAAAVTRTSGSLLGDAPLIRKVYFPRLLIPLAAAAVPLVDFGFGCLALFGLMAWYRVAPTWGILALPGFLLLAFLSALGVALFPSALNVRFRDVGYAIPFLVQTGMYASPVVYSVSLVPERWRSLYSLNPMVSVIEGFRWALLGKTGPHLADMALSGSVVLGLLLGALVYFKFMERTFADVI
jgi:lipopolysaccharide transport system permease protein